MSFERFATAMIAIGAGLGLAATSAVPTSQRSPEKAYPTANAADYPEISAVTYESYPIAQAPLMRRAPLKLAGWDAPWSSDTSESYASVPDYVEPEFTPDPQVIEDDIIPEPTATERPSLSRVAFEPADEAQAPPPVRITLSDLP